MICQQNSRRGSRCRAYEAPRPGGAGGKGRSGLFGRLATAPTAAGVAAPDARRGCCRLLLRATALLGFVSRLRNLPAVGARAPHRPCRRARAHRLPILEPPDGADHMLMFTGDGAAWLRGRLPLEHAIFRPMGMRCNDQAAQAAAPLWGGAARLSIPPLCQDVAPAASRRTDPPPHLRLAGCSAGAATAATTFALARTAAHRRRSRCCHVRCRLRCRLRGRLRRVARALLRPRRVALRSRRRHNAISSISSVRSAATHERVTSTLAAYDSVSTSTTRTVPISTFASGPVRAARRATSRRCARPSSASRRTVPALACASSTRSRTAASH